MASLSPKQRARRGQSLIESCLAIIVVCLVFAGMYQVAGLVAAREVLDYSAARAARAKTVGFNRWMVRKAAKVGAIPNAGRLTEPAYTNVDRALRARVASSSGGELWDWVLGEAAPSSAQYDLERARIPEFLEAANDATAYYVLDYTDWDSVVNSFSLVGGTGVVWRAVTDQTYPLRVPMHRAFYADDEIDLQGRAYIEDHYSLYMEDRSW